MVKRYLETETKVMEIDERDTQTQNEREIYRKTQKGKVIQKKEDRKIQKDKKVLKY